jgi:C1A family cysteine protease
MVQIIRPIQKAIKPITNSRFGWRPELPDHRDYKYSARRTKLQPIQTVKLWLKNVLPFRRDQLRIGSCTGFGIAFILSFLVQNKQYQAPPKIKMPFSPLFIYWNERASEGTINEDSGAFIRDGVKSVADFGCCSDNAWPYIQHIFKRKPSRQAYQEALDYQSIEYWRLDNTNKQELVNCLLEGYPIVHGFTVYSDFDTDRVAATGIVNLPTANEYILGGHCTVIIGYDVDLDVFYCANSWGEDWGMVGIYTIPAAYLCDPNLADDFWTIRVIE